MALEAKICGPSTPGTLDVAVAEGAAFVGFVFFPRSPRNVSLAQAAALAALVSVRALHIIVIAVDRLLAPARVVAHPPPQDRA